MNGGGGGDRDGDVTVIYYCLRGVETPLAPTPLALPSSSLADQRCQGQQDSQPATCCPHAGRADRIWEKCVFPPISEVRNSKGTMYGIEVPMT